MARYAPDIAVILVVAGIVTTASAADSSVPPVETRPRQVREGTIEPTRGYVSSDACRSCHPVQHASWHRSYHRTMTQVVTAETVIADFEGIELELDGARYVLDHREDGFWVDLPDPTALDRLAANGPIDPSGAGLKKLPRVERQIAMSTGLHHYQLYWYPSGRGRELYMLPFVFLREEQRWAPRSSVFLEPPGLPEKRLIWNVNCLPCHSTDGQPGYSSDLKDAHKGPDTRVAELGIACEACHGPGQEHVKQRQEGWSGAAMVHPRSVPAGTSAQICGQCHSVNVPYTRKDWVDWLVDGPSYRAGQDLSKSRYIVHPETVSKSPLIQEWIAQNPDELTGLFWPDGMVRVTGREYNGLLASPCFEGGNFSCVTCHSQHQAEPDDLLAAEMRTDKACLQCHTWQPAAIARHTHHEPSSSGSRCYNCHMPHTTYGLLKASRSHTIDSPSVESDLHAGRPNACNLCHLDRTLEWTAEHLTKWYGHQPAELNSEQNRTAASVRGLLQGNAALRALYAWHMGWPPAHKASGSSWIAPLLAQTLEDPYDVVRYIAERSLKRLPGFGQFDYDFVAPPADRKRYRERAVRIWESLEGRRSDRTEPEILFSDDGAFRLDMAERLREERDDTPMALRE